MKKFALSVFVVVSFVLYSLSQRQRISASMQVGSLNNSAQLSPVSNISTTSVPINDNSKVANTPTPTPLPVVTLKPSQGIYKDGQYTGKAYDAYYGYVQVGAKIQNGRLVDVSFLQYPNDRGHSVMVSNYSLPILRQEAIQNQSANVNIVSGATDTSLAFRQSLSSALASAK